MDTLELLVARIEQQDDVFERTPLRDRFMNIATCARIGAYLHAVEDAGGQYGWNVE